MNRVVAFPFGDLRASGGIPADLMAEFLDCLPNDAKFVGTFVDNSRNIDYLVFSSDEWPAVKAGQRPTEATIYFVRNPDGTEHLDCIKYENGVIDRPRFKNSVRPTSNKNCIHNWTEYFGVKESYRYCADCGEKETQ